MFYIGSNVMNHPLEAQRALADGHEICVHTWSHPYMTATTSEQAFAELYYTMQAIKLVVGVTPTCWRPPYGDVDDRIRAIAKGLGLKAVLWQYDSNDWMVGDTATTPAQVDANYNNLITSAQNGTFNTVSTPLYWQRLKLLMSVLARNNHSHARVGQLHYARSHQLLPQAQSRFQVPRTRGRRHELDDTLC